MARRGGILKVAVGLSMAGAALGLGAVQAFACTSLASLNLSTAAGPAGSQLTVTGSSFNPSAAADADGTFSPVTIHWGSATGPVIAQSVVPDQTGAISTAVTVPADAAPGFYPIVATQTQLTGGSGPAYGTPARTSFQVTASGVAPANALPAAQQPGAVQPTTPAPTVTSTSSIGAGLIVLMVALGVGGLLLLGLGTATLMGGGRRAGVPSKARKS